LVGNKGEEQKVGGRHTMEERERTTDLGEDSDSDSDLSESRYDEFESETSDSDERE
jgi:hypothetical protein